MRLGDLGRDRGQRERRAGDGAGGHDRERQRQARAQRDDLSRRRRLRRDAVRAETAAQEVGGFSGGQQVEAQRVGAVAGDEAGELVAARDDHQAAAGTGQQRTDLSGVVGVVQQ